MVLRNLEALIVHLNYINHNLKCLYYNNMIKIIIIYTLPFQFYYTHVVHIFITLHHIMTNKRDKTKQKYTNYQLLLYKLSYPNQKQ